MIIFFTFALDSHPFRWTSEIKLQKAPKEAPNAPLPLCVARTIPRPDVASAFDVDDLTIKLWIDGLEVGTATAATPVDISDEGAAASSAAAPPADGLPVRVEVDGPLPKGLYPRIAQYIRDRWAAEIRARGASKSWFLEKLLAWAEGAFIELISLDKSLVEQYEGVNDEGMTIRRYTIAEPPPPPPPPPPPKGSDEESSEEESSDEELEPEPEPQDIDARVAKMSLDPEAERKMRIKLKAEAEAERMYKEQRRKEAEEDRQAGRDEPKGLSKKEQEKAKAEKIANKSGVRLRKAGAKHNKFDAEAAGKKKNNKNGLLH